MKHRTRRFQSAGSFLERLEPRTLLAAAPPVVKQLGQFGGRLESVVAAGDFAYLGHNRMLTVLDARDPAAMKPLGSVALPAAPYDLVLSGSLVYAAAGDAGLQIIDVSDPAAPVLLGGYDTSGLSSGVDVIGNRAYIAHFDGMEIIDVANPAAPVRLGGVTGTALSVDVEGSLAYIASRFNGLRIYDVSDPASIKGKGGYSALNYAGDVDVEGARAYVAGDSGGLNIIDVANPAACTLLGNYDLYSANNVIVSGDTAYIDNLYEGLEILDVTDPAAPVRTAKFEPRSTTPEHIALDGNRIYFVDRGATILDVVDVSDRTSPLRLGGYAPTRSAGYAVMATPSVALVSEGFFGVRVMDLSKPDAPLDLGRYDTPGTATKIEVRGHLAYVADQAGGLQIIDIANPAAPTFVGEFGRDGSTGITDVQVVGSLAYVMHTYGLKIIDVANPAAPALVGQLFYDGPKGSLFVSGSRAYATAGNSGFHIFDVTNPAAPTRLGGYDTLGSATSIVVSGNTAYVGDGSRGLLALNVANPAAPAPLGTFTGGSYYGGLALDGPYLYSAYFHALSVFDVSAGGAPARIASHVIDGGNITLAGTLALMCAGLDGLSIVRIAPPDALAPHATAARLLPANDRMKVRFTFDESVIDSLSRRDVTLTPAEGGAGVEPESVVYDPATNSAVASFATGLAAGIYDVTLHASGVTDAWGNALAAARTLRVAYVPDGATLVLPPGAATTVQDIAIAGRLELGTSGLIVDYDAESPIGPWTGVAYAGIHALLASGRAGGPGIFSSAAQGDLKYAAAAEAFDALRLTGGATNTFAGQTVDATSVLIKLTWGGDATLDGKIDIDDYGQIDFNIGSSGSVWGYFVGDFNLDGKINIDDYGIIDFNVVAQNAIL